MKKYRLELYGWDVETVGHSITDKQVEQIQSLMKEQGHDEVWEVRHDLEDYAQIDLPDWWSPDLLHETKPLDNSALRCYLYDEDNKETIWDFHEMLPAWEVVGDDKADELNEVICAIPEYLKDVDNILCSFDENKGCLSEYTFESDTIPTPKDFYYTNNCIETPEGDWDVIDRIFFKGEELDLDDWGDTTGKASTVEIYRKDGTIIR